jgi:hypothetical protein
MSHAKARRRKEGVELALTEIIHREQEAAEETEFVETLLSLLPSVKKIHFRSYKFLKAISRSFAP